MEPFIWIAILVFVLLVVGALLLAAVTMRRSSTDSDITEGELHPQGYYVSLGISIGAGAGVAIGLVFDNLALGIAIGAAVGASIGGVLEQKNKDKIRPLSSSEEQNRKRGVLVGVVIAIIGLVVLLGLLLLVAK